MHAAAVGDENRAKELIRTGADINENVGTPDEALTPLLAATIAGHPAIATLLLKNGAALEPCFRGHDAFVFALRLFGGDSAVIREMEGR